MNYTSEKNREMLIIESNTKLQNLLHTHAFFCCGFFLCGFCLFVCFLTPGPPAVQR